ncbi:hypothetical protein RM844_24970 [Streptomyces sp. DSM 44915]|uniref:Uncharacterized protein n=1 Tax=Streptomyces chisholmiae TaxID=3075540 RepID=A0ABU2JYE3_9ACTN|nr:hypothetical protein [Streptomyces sp. DSM 44915]MDT0269539.1 hypothetical protein [Streptomyces sp. DSM 44915]
MTHPEPEYVFEQVQIGKGLKPLAQHGFVLVGQGTLTLLGSDRQHIDAGPLAQVSAKPVRFTRGQTLSLTVNGNKYNVSPGWGSRGVFVLPGDTEHVKSAAEALRRLIAAGGGQA